MRRIMFLFLLVLSLFSSQSYALNRDFRTHGGCYCFFHIPGDYPDNISPRLLALIPRWSGYCSGGFECEECDRYCVYPGYVDCDFQKYSLHLKNYLQYCDTHQDCNCFWPEYSQEAAQISDAAYLLFRDLIATTALSSLLDDEDEQKSFIETNFVVFNLHGLTSSFISNQFLFSDYYHVCRDIENYAEATYENSENVGEIKHKLLDILNALYPKFLALYNICNQSHPSELIEREILFMRLLEGDIEALTPSVKIDKNSISQAKLDASDLFINNLQTAHLPVYFEDKGIPKEDKNQKDLHINLEPFSKPSTNPGSIFSVESEIFLEQGTILNSLLLYQDAIQILTKAIESNSYNRNAYIERALAYFETNQITLALKDYDSATKLVVPPYIARAQNLIHRGIYVPENKIEFSQGLISGTMEGGKLSAINFIPSTFSSFRGILNGLWCFTCSPIDVSKELIKTAYAMGDFISNHTAFECLQCVVPEIQELSLNWKILNDRSRGEKIGFIIGKYGVDIFAPIAAFKGVGQVQALRRANTICTLESCAASQANQTIILEESVKRALLRVSYLEASKHGKILVKSSNVQHHVMQSKHAWDKVLKITGNVNDDFKKVVSLLEEINILDKSNLKEVVRFGNKLTVSEYRKTVKGHELQVFFENYTETSEVFLKNAWIITKNKGN